jgi:haloalkane dehalogenase
MQVLRTPESRFAEVPDFPFVPHYREIGDADGTILRLAFIDEGPRDADPILLLHGEPTWSFLYRRILARLVAEGHRVVAPDLIGFGRSDKPSEPSDYTYERHVRWMSDWLLSLDLARVTFFGQDWGGLIGLRLVAAHPGRFARIVVANTGLPTGSGFSEGFAQWLAYSQSVPELPIGDIVAMGCRRPLTTAERAAYDAPFPDESHKAGARRFPALVPITPEHPSVAENTAAWTVLERFARPCLTAFSDGDPITRGGEREFQRRIPGAQGQAHVTIADAGHFLQEDQPDAIAALLHRFTTAST